MAQIHLEPLSDKGNIRNKGESIETNSKTVCKGDFEFAVQTHHYINKTQILYH